MKEPNRKVNCSLAVAHLCVVVVPDSATTTNNNMLSVTLNAQRIIFSGHLILKIKIAMD